MLLFRLLKGLLMRFSDVSFKKKILILFTVPLLGFLWLSITNAINNVLIIDFDIATLFDSIDIRNLNQVMIPGKEAVKIADILPNLFSLNE